MTPPTQPFVSVIIPAYNAATVIGRQLEALACQTDAPEFEVVVADNRSTDDLSSVVASFVDRLNIRIVDAGAAQGVSFARNVGIRHAVADLLMFCDADDVVASNWLAQGLKDFEAETLWSGSVRMLPDAALGAPLAEVWEQIDAPQEWAPPVHEQDHSPFPVLLGGNFGVTRAAMEKIGGFDQAIPVRGEDNDLAIRAVKIGLRVAVSKSTWIAAGFHDGQQMRIARADAKAHALLAIRHGLRGKSPFRPVPEEWLRLAADGVRMLAWPARRDWPAWKLRAARTLGWTEGVFEYQIRKQLPQPREGQGWGRKTMQTSPSEFEGAPSASVIIPAYNAGRWIEEQLDSLAQQEEAPSFEVVIGDNGSSDDTVPRALSGKWPFPVRVVDARGMQSASYARNVAASMASSEKLLFCDADDLVSPQWVAALCSALEAADGALISGAIHHERFNDADVLAAYRLPADPTSEQMGEMPTVESASGYAGYLPTVPGGSFAVTKEVYFKAGGMDASYPGGAEETDFAWRLQTEHGVRVVSAPRAAIHYRLKHEPRSLFRQQRIQQRGRVLLWVRNRNTSMQGPSWKTSLSALAKALRTYPSSRGSRRSRLMWAQEAGAHAGAVEGMIRYRLLKRLPKPAFHQVAE